MFLLFFQWSERIQPYFCCFYKGTRHFHYWPNWTKEGWRQSILLHKILCLTLNKIFLCELNDPMMSVLFSTWLLKHKHHHYITHLWLFSWWCLNNVYHIYVSKTHSVNSWCVIWSKEMQFHEIIVIFERTNVYSLRLQLK